MQHETNAFALMWSPCSSFFWHGSMLW